MQSWFFYSLYLDLGFRHDLQDYRKAALYEEVEAASPLEHLL